MLNRALHNFLGTCFSYSSFKTVDKLGRFPFKHRLCCAYNGFQTNALRLRSEVNFYPAKTHVDVHGQFPAFLFQPKMILRSSNPAMLLNIFSYGSMVSLYCHFFAAISKRSFCNAPGAFEHKADCFSVKDGGSRGNSSPRGFNWKLSKAIAAHKRNTVSNLAPEKNSSHCSVSSTKCNHMVNSGDQILMDKMDEAVELSSSSDGIGRQKSLGKGKLKEQHRIGESKAVPSADVTVGKNYLKPKTQKFHRQGKTNKEESEVAVDTSSHSKLSQSQKSHASGKNKLQEHSKFQQLYPPTTKSVVVVESITKAKVMQGYLGDMFEVLPSYGHVRDLAPRSGSVRPDDDFSMVWEVPSAAWTHLKSIKVALGGAKNLVLALDPDREGEAIAWHIIEMLKQQDALNADITVARVVFTEMTESSIKSALQAPREIDVNLVHAYLARRALDYLIGFNISPLLWRKLPGCQSAGRVQSAALALICDREKEIDEFKLQEYWTVEVKFNKNLPKSTNVISFSSHLTHFDSQNMDQVSISSQAEASNIEQHISSSTFEVLALKISRIREKPPAPYITSTLQQDASNKLNFTVAYTMKLAQKLYEGVQLTDGQAAGLITYMRTDGMYISDDMAKDIQSFVIEKYGQNFVSKSVYKFFKKVKNAQEAHEAIRPTNIRRLPSLLSGALDEDCLKLYTLIWSRTIACQMEPTTVDQIQLDIGNAGESIILRSVASRVEFLGHQAVLQDMESNAIRLDENEENNPGELFEVLSALKPGDLLNLDKLVLEQHYTMPKPRYCEGALVKKVEELCIGRPSTYATMIKVLKDRNFITVKSRVLYPEFSGRMVSAFLLHYFSEVTDYSFTAEMETELDNVSAGLTEWKGLLKDYWTRFSKCCERASNVHNHQVEKMLEKSFGYFLFDSLPNGSRTCPSCLDGTLIFKISRFGAGYFIGCDRHPKCKYIAKTLYGEDHEEATTENKNHNVDPPKLLGIHPASNEKILLKNGPYGYYVQLGEDRKGYLPKRASISEIKDVDSITLEDALEFLRYPVTLGKHPDDGFPVMILNKKGWLSVKHRRTRAPVPKNLKPGDITLEKALKLLLSKGATKSGRPKSRLKLEESYESI